MVSRASFHKRDAPAGDVMHRRDDLEFNLDSQVAKISTAPLKALGCRLGVGRRDLLHKIV